MNFRNLSISLFLAIALLFAGEGCKGGKKGGKTKGGEVPAEVAEAFKEDASRMVVRDLTTSGAMGGELQGVIPPTLVDKYYQALCKIYLLAKKMDTLPDLGQIHTARRPDLKVIRLRIKSDASFRDNWSKGISLTSDLFLNNMIGKHRMELRNFKDSPMGPTVQLVSPSYINTPEVAMLLSHVTGIESAESDAVAGDGNNIEAGGDGKNGTTFKFSIGKGDCPSGCIYRKYWIFLLNTDNSITYIGTKGSIPEGEE